MPKNRIYTLGHPRLQNLFWIGIIKLEICFQLDNPPVRKDAFFHTEGKYHEIVQIQKS